MLLLPASIPQTVCSSQPLLPAIVPLKSDTDWCADLPFEPAVVQTTPEVICLPVRSALLTADISKITFEGDYQPTSREVFAGQILAAEMIKRGIWDGRSKRVIIRDADRIRYEPFQMLDIKIGPGAIYVVGPLSYKDSARKWETKTRGTSGRSKTARQAVPGQFKGVTRTFIQGV